MMDDPVIVTDPILIVTTPADTFWMPVRKRRRRVATSKCPLRLIVRITNGSLVRTVLVELKIFARPSGAIVNVELKISGLLGTMVTNVFNTAPSFVITIG